ncbi:bis(5'-nucleosyl)-tetraphosphatase (symmetrical) [Gammaproteobacteria bacterium 53_120_T64]|nr:bis(5'-nucleosyl)-tetraphosphatase (symmetrical) [Gammaproteobacteria bacterium 53_120_T64]
MAIYAVGDLQGCLEPLLCLLKEIDFDPKFDQLWAAGDVVNRGPQSLETLRFVKGLGQAFKMVLGNHDLHLLAVAHGVKRLNPKDTLQAILQAPDREELLTWLQRQPLLLRSNGYVMVHAGIPPHWDLATAKCMAGKVETVLRSDHAERFFDNMYGDTPTSWQPSQTESVQLRTITNYFTRMRYCNANGELELKTKQGPEHSPIGFAPWFSHRARRSSETKILFGHWASIDGESGDTNTYPLDTGCVWGGRLRIMSLDTGELSHCDCTETIANRSGR